MNTRPTPASDWRPRTQRGNTSDVVVAALAIGSNRVSVGMGLAYRVTAAVGVVGNLSVKQ